jgi:hypothetical protein
LENPFARKHPENQKLRDQKRDELDDQYHPTTPYELACCDTLADVLERLKSTRPGGMEHQRLAALAQSLFDQLEAMRRTALADAQPTYRLVVEFVIVDPVLDPSDREDVIVDPRESD